MESAESSRYPAPGTLVDGKYRIDRMLGEGGMGAVAGAFHMLRRAPVALKFISPDLVRVPGAVDRFVNEAVAASQIDSDHVVRIFDVGQLPSGLPYIVMEMMVGCDLSELLEREGTKGFPVPRAVHFVLQILRALQIAHAAGIIHRDLKPSNAFVITKDNEPDFVKLLDFGISKITQEGSEQQHLTQTNTGLGTPLYMSPEQARNARDATGKSDLYSVSAMLYELLTGRTPYTAESPNDLLYKLFTADPDPIGSVRADLPPGLAELVHAGLAKDADQRPGSATEYAELLSPFADGRSVTLVTRIRSGQAAPASHLSPVAGPPSQVPVLASTMVADLDTIPTSFKARSRAGLESDKPPPSEIPTLPAPAPATQLEMGMSNPSTASPARRGPMVAAVVGACVLLGVGGTVALRTPPPQAPAPALQTSAQRPAVPVPQEVTPVPSGKPPEIAPAVDSAGVAPTSSAPAADPSKKKPGPTQGGPPLPPPKKDPFGAGIVR